MARPKNIKPKKKEKKLERNPKRNGLVEIKIKLLI